MGVQSSTAEKLVARIASRAHGVVTRDELLTAGLTPKQIERRIAKGLLIRGYPAVYRVGHNAPSVEARYMAAVKAGGDEALLCDSAAGYLLDLLRSRTVPPPEVLTPTARRIKGLRTRRTRRIDPRDATTFKNIPVTTVPRTLVDLAAVLDEEALARACHEAGVKYRTTPMQVEAVLQRRPNAPGAGKLRRIMGGDVKVLLSKLEERFIERVKEEGLPLPKTNKVKDGRRVDCRWPDKGVTVELDGFRFHNSRHSWDQGLQRERDAYARDDEFRRYGYTDVFEKPDRMFAELRKLLR